MSVEVCFPPKPKAIRLPVQERDQFASRSSAYRSHQMRLAKTQRADERWSSASTSEASRPFRSAANRDALPSHGTTTRLGPGLHPERYLALPRASSDFASQFCDRVRRSNQVE